MMPLLATLESCEEELWASVSAEADLTGGTPVPVGTLTKSLAVIKRMLCPTKMSTLEPTGSTGAFASRSFSDVSMLIAFES